MAKVINEKHVYPQNAEDLFKIYSTEDWIPQRYEGIGMRNVSISKCVQNGDVWTVESNREVKANVPGALKKLAKEWNAVTQKETWTKQGDSYDCHFTVSIHGLPVDIIGHMIVAPEDKGSSNTIELNIKSSIPFIGKVAEEFVAGDIDASMAQEYEWIQAFLNKNV